MSAATKGRSPLTDRDVAELAAAADVDPRTVVRALAGLPVRGRVGVRVARVLADRRVTGWFSVEVRAMSEDEAQAVGQ